MHTPDSIDNLLGAAARRDSASPAILGLGRDPLSYRGLLDQIGSVTAALRDHGVRREDCVAIVLPNGPEMAACTLAVASWCCCAPLNPGYTATELDFYLSDLQPRAVIVEAGPESPIVAAAAARGIPILRLHVLREEPAGVFRLEGPCFEDCALDPRAAAPDGAALLLHTSGSTARPKLTPLTQANLCRSARNIADSLSLSPADRCLNVMPLFHIHGLIGAVLSSLAAGASAACAPGFHAPDFLSWIDHFRPTWYTAVPSMHQAILARATRQGRPPRRTSLRFIRSCSSALAPKLMAALEAAFSVPVVEAYGMTEASHQMAINPLPPRARKPGSVGLAAGCEIAIVDAAGALLAAGVTGEVVIRGANVTKGYVNNPGANRASFFDGWFRTGDQGFLDGDGYLFLTGRLKEIINRGGEKISPREIDETLLDHPAVAQALAFSMPSRQLGEEVAAAVVLRENAVAAETELQEFVAARLADFKVPRRIVFLPELPKGPTGKPQRIGLAGRLKLDEAAPPPAAEGLASGRPLTPVESRLAAIWRDLLRVERAGADDDFFDLGGDSILGAQLIVRVRDAFGVELPMFRLFNSPRLAALAQWIESAPRAASDCSAPIPPAPREAPPLASFAQERMWFLTRFEEAAPAYITPTVLRMRGYLRIDALRSALQSVIDRHEVLRVTYPCPEGVPVLTIKPQCVVDLPVVDLRHLTESERESRVQQAAGEEAFRPFDLSVDLPVRALLLRLAPEEHVLLLTVHHIAFDGWSKSVFFRELSVSYKAAVTDVPPDLPDLPIQYSDYAAWQRRLLEGEAGARLEAYWKKRLNGIPTVLDLPSDRPRPSRQTYRGGIERMVLPPPLAEELRRLSRAESVTLFMTLLAGFQVLLQRYSRQTDICVGVPVAGRVRRETEVLVGLFVNVLAMRTDLSGNPSFRTALARVRETALGAYDHQDMPLERLVEIARPERSLSYAPLFQVMFQLRNFPEIDYHLEGLENEVITLDPGTSQFDLYLDLTETADGLAAALTYCADQFDRSTARRMLGHYKMLLEAAAADPEAAIGRLPLLTAGERRQALVEWNQTGKDYPVVSALKLFEEQAARTPSATAAVHGGRRWSYRELDRHACGVAERLREIGVSPGSRVAVAVDHSLEMLAALMGIWKTGATWIPLDLAHPRERLAFIIEDAAPAALIAEPQFHALWEHASAPLLDLKTVAPRDGGEFPGVGPDAIAYLLYTSGSTGRPKGVGIRHSGLTNCLAFLRGEIPVTARDVVLAHTTLAFDLSILEIVLPLISGARVAVVGRDAARDGKRLARAISDYGAGIVQGTPATFRLLLESGWKPPAGLRIISGGEALAPDLAERLLPCGALWNLYGPTECAIYCTGQRVRDARSASAIGKPIANTRAYVVDDNSEPVPVGVPGELWIGGAGVAPGYWKRDDLTAERFVPDPFGEDPAARLYRTGDLVRRLPDGALDYLGRIDQQVKLRGQRIELGEIESVLREHPAVLAAAAKMVDAPPGDGRLAAWFVLRPDGECAETDLRDLLKRRLPSYMQPAFLVRLEALPMTPSGKTDRNALRLPDCLPAGAAGIHRAPSTAREVVMAEIWEDILGRGPIGLDDDFFELGGHSLLGARLLTRVENAFDARLPLESLFLAPTVARMLELLNREASRAPSPRVIPLRIGTRRVPLVMVPQALFHPLVLKLPSEQSICSVAFLDTSALPAPFNLQQIAARHVDVLLRFNTGGPLALAGWCAEGVLAYEMAQQIRARGIDVPLLVLFDSYNAAAHPNASWLSRERVRYHLAAASQLPAGSLLTYGRDRLRTVAERFRTKAWRARYRRELMTGQGAAASLRHPDQLLALAAKEYSPQPYSGAVLFFRPQSRPAGDAADAASGWRELAPRLRVVDVPGNHVEMFREPNVAVMAEALDAALREIATPQASPEVGQASADFSLRGTSFSPPRNRKSFAATLPKPPAA
jgi:amino acid adenylation domain-containing protein